jgi:hypothetical protein
VLQTLFKCLTRVMRGRFGLSSERACYPSDFRDRVFRRTNFPTCDIAGIALRFYTLICRTPDAAPSSSSCHAILGMIEQSATAVETATTRSDDLRGLGR